MLITNVLGGGAALTPSLGPLPCGLWVLFKGSRGLTPCLLSLEPVTRGRDLLLAPGPWRPGGAQVVVVSAGSHLNDHVSAGAGALPGPAACLRSRRLWGSPWVSPGEGSEVARAAACCHLTDGYLHLSVGGDAQLPPTSHQSLLVDCLCFFQLVGLGGVGVQTFWSVLIPSAQPHKTTPPQGPGASPRPPAPLTHPCTAWVPTLLPQFRLSQSGRGQRGTSC